MKLKSNKARIRECTHSRARKATCGALYLPIIGATRNISVTNSDKKDASLDGSHQDLSSGVNRIACRSSVAEREHGVGLVAYA